MRLDFDLVFEVDVIVVKDKFPIAFALVLIDDGYSFVSWLFYRWSFFNVTLLNAVLFWLSHIVRFIQRDGFVIFGEIHVTIGALMVNQ